MRKPSDEPFKLLGGRLKLLREKHKQTVAEVSGAVEIEMDLLGRYERGEQRPNEEVLMLLISHFDISDDDATQLWELAGYNDGAPESSNQTQFTPVVPIDLRIIYTDMVHVVVNNYGVVMNFMQNAGPNNQSLAVARVGMSKEHAKSVLEVLQETLAQADHPAVPKALLAPKAKKQSQE